MLRSILSYFTVGGTTIETFIRDVEDAMQGPQSDNLTESQLYQLETDVAKFKSDVDLYSSNYVKFYERLEQAARLEDDLITESEQYVTIASEILYGIHTLFQTTFMSASRDTFTTFDKLYTDNTNLRHLTQAIIDTVTEHVIATKDSIVTLDDENTARITRDTAHTVHSVLSETYHEYTKESDVLYTHIIEQLKGLQTINIYRNQSTSIDDLLEISSNIQMVLIKSPFNLPLELFVAATSKEIGQWAEQLGEQIGNVYKEYISPDRITNAFNDSDTVINAISSPSTQDRVPKLKALEKLLLTYEGVYQSIVDDNFSNGRGAYDDDVDSNPDVVVEREKITNMLITVFDIDRTLFQIEQPIESEDVIRAKAQEMSIWLNLMPTKSAGNTTYNSGFVDSITSKTSFTTTAADIARENWDNFNIAYTAMQEGVLSTQLIAMMEQFKSTNPAVESISTDLLGTDTLKEIIRDWLTEMGLVDPNILAYTTITRADMKTPNINSLYTSWDTYKKDLFYVAKEISSMCLIVNDINKMKRGKNTSNVAIVNPFGKLSSNLTIEFFIERIKALNNGRGHTTNTQAEISVLENAQILAGQIIGLDKADESAWRNQRTTSVSIAVTSSRCISTLKTSLANNSQNKYLQGLERYQKLETEYSNLSSKSKLGPEKMREINERIDDLQRMQNQITEHEKARNELDNEMKVIHNAQTKERQVIDLLREIKTEINNNLNNSNVKRGARAFEVLNFGIEVKRLFQKLNAINKAAYYFWLTIHLETDSSMQITPILLQIDRTVAELSATYNEAKKVFDEKKAYKANIQESISAVNKSIAQKQVPAGRDKETIAQAERFLKASEAKQKELNSCIAEMSEQEGTLLLQMSSVLKTMKDNKISVSPDFIAVFTELLR